jgi:hypothetical protein
VGEWGGRVVGVGGGGEQARNSHTVCGMLVCEGWRRIGVGHTRPFFGKSVFSVHLLLS